MQDKVLAWSHGATESEIRQMIAGLRVALGAKIEQDKQARIAEITTSDDHEDFEGSWLEYLKEFYRRTQGDFDDWSDGINAQKLMDSPYYKDVEVSHGERQNRYEPSTRWISTTGDKAYSYSDCIDEPPCEEWNKKKRIWRMPKSD